VRVLAWGARCPSATRLSDPPQVRQSVRDRNKLDDACPSHRFDKPGGGLLKSINKMLK